MKTSFLSKIPGKIAGHFLFQQNMIEEVKKEYIVANQNPGNELPGNFGCLFET
jgi:hypothetical protein